MATEPMVRVPVLVGLVFALDETLKSFIELWTVLGNKPKMPKKKFCFWLCSLLFCHVLIVNSFSSCERISCLYRNHRFKRQQTKGSTNCKLLFLEFHSNPILFRGSWSRKWRMLNINLNVTMMAARSNLRIRMSAKLYSVWCTNLVLKVFHVLFFRFVSTPNNKSVWHQITFGRTICCPFG